MKNKFPNQCRFGNFKAEMAKKSVKSIFSSRQRNIVYLLLALPLLWIAVIGIPYGGLFPFAILAAICIVQFFRPTWIGWLIVFLPCAALTVTYGIRILADLVTIPFGARPSILVDLDDSVFFFFSVLIFSGLCYWLWRVRPKSKSSA